MTIRCVWKEMVMIGKKIPFNSLVVKMKSKMMIQKKMILMMDLEPPPEVKTFMEAVEALKDVSQFLESCGHVQVSGT